VNKKVTTEDFIAKAKLVHKDKYDYSKAIYTRGRDFIIIICPIHHTFQQRANCHTSGKGCKECAVINRAKKKTYSKEKFVEKANKVFGNKYSYENTVYKDSKSLVTINCPIHGEFNKNAAHHLNGQGCLTCSNLNHKGTFKAKDTEYFKSKAYQIHGDKYDYSLSEYKAAIQPIKIICKIHGEFMQTPHTHLNGSGCNECGILATTHKRRSTLDYFILKANEVHTNKYVYDNVIYKNTNTKIEITCPSHGNFKQTGGSHLSGNGCPICAREATTRYSQENPLGWSYSKWLETSKTSSDFDSFKLYIIRCWDENEEFYKIGRTFKKIKKRFDDKRTMPYNYEISYEFCADGSYICDLEVKLKKTYKKVKYVPSIQFSGSTECFTTDLPIAEIIAKYFEVQS